MANAWESAPIVDTKKKVQQPAAASSAAMSSGGWQDAPIVSPAQPQAPTATGGAGTVITQPLADIPGSQVDDGFGGTVTAGLKQNYEDFMTPVREASSQLGEDAKRIIGGRFDKIKQGDFSGTAAPGQTQQQADMQDALTLGGDAVNYTMAPFNGAVHAMVAPFTRAANNAIVDSGRVVPSVALKPQQGSILPRVDVNANIDRQQSFENLDNAVGTVGGIASMALGNESGALKAVKAAQPSKAALTAETAQRLERANVTPLPVLVDGGKGKVAATNFVAENPVAGILTRGRLQKAVDQVDTQAGVLSQRFGAARGPQIAGENVQAGVRRFSRGDAAPPADLSAPARDTSFNAKASTAYDRAFSPILKKEGEIVANEQTRIANQTQAAKAKQQAEIARQTELRRLQPNGAQGPVDVPLDPVAPATAAVRPSDTMATLKDINGRVNAPALSSVITSGPFQKIAKALESDGADVRFSDLRNLRTYVREAQSNPELRQNIGSANLQRLESALTNDIYANAESLGGTSALHKLKQADQFYKAGSQRIQKALQPFASAKSGESAYSRIMQAAGSKSSADAESLLALKRSLQPEEWGDVSANVLSEMGKAKAGAQSADGDAFSVASFVTRYNELSPKGKDILFGSLGGGGKNASELRKAVDDLAFAADRVKNVEKGANTSKSGTVGQLIATVGGLSNPGTFLPAAGGLTGMTALGEAMTNPAFVRKLAKAVRADAGLPVNKVQGVLSKATKAGALTNAAANSQSVQLPALTAPSYATKAAAEPALTPQKKPDGQIEAGNIDLHSRPKVKNSDGSYSTVRSISVEMDGKTYLLPTVVGNRVVSNKDAIDHFKKTGEHLGAFRDGYSADKYAETLHEEQAKEYERQ